jgi:hypothetical protein
VLDSTPIIIKSWATLDRGNSLMELVYALTRSLPWNSYTLAPVIDEGVSCLSFHLEDED